MNFDHIKEQIPGFEINEAGSGFVDVFSEDANNPAARLTLWESGECAIEFVSLGPSCVTIHKQKLHESDFIMFYRMIDRLIRGH